MRTSETRLCPCVFSLSDLISLPISCGVRAQALPKRLFVLCVWCGSAYCDEARQRSGGRSSWETTDMPRRHVRVPESFRLDRTLEISHIPAGALRSGSLRWELETSVWLQTRYDERLNHRSKMKTQGLGRKISDHLRLAEEFIVPVRLRAVSR